MDLDGNPRRRRSTPARIDRCLPGPRENLRQGRAGRIIGRSDSGLLRLRNATGKQPLLSHAPTQLFEYEADPALLQFQRIGHHAVARSPRTAGDEWIVGMEPFQRLEECRRQAKRTQANGVNLVLGDGVEDSIEELAIGIFEVLAGEDRVESQSNVPTFLCNPLDGLDASFDTWNAMLHLV